MSFPTIPTVASGDLLSSTTSPASTTHTFPNLSSLRGGAGPQAGDLLIAVIVQYQGGTANAEFGTWGASFTEILDDALATGTGNGAIGVARKVATGSESGTFTVTSAHSFKSVQFLLRIPAGTWHGTTAPETSGSTRAAGAVADPASFDPANWAAEDTLWIAVAGQTETSTTGSPPTLNTPPTNYSGELIVARVADAVGDITAGVAFRQVNASAEDVGAWAASNAVRGNGIATVIAVRPALVPAKAQISWAELEVPGVSATPKAGTDSGAGTEAKALTASLPRSDSGSRTETATLVFRTTRTESGSGTDASFLKQQKAGTDSGTGVDASTEKAVFPRTDTGTGTETIKAKASVVAQAGTSTEVSSEQATYARTESGSGTETSKVSRPVADTGTGADTSSARATYTRTETGAGVDARVETAVYARADSGTETDASAITRRYAVTQTGAGGDASTQKAVYGVTEAGTGTDVSTLQAGNAKHGTDAGVGADSLKAKASVVTQTATGADSSSVSQGAVAKAGTDAGFGVDSSSVRASLARFEVGVCNDTSLIRASLSRVDACTGTDLTSINKKVVQTGAGADASLTRALHIVSQPGVAFEVAAILALLGATETGAGDEVQIVFKGQLPPDRVSASIVGSRTTTQIGSTRSLSNVGLNRGGEDSTIEGERGTAEVTS